LNIKQNIEISKKKRCCKNPKEFRMKGTRKNKKCQQTMGGRQLTAWKKRRGTSREERESQGGKGTVNQEHVKGGKRIERGARLERSSRRKYSKEGLTGGKERKHQKQQGKSKTSMEKGRIGKKRGDQAEDR